MSKNEIIAAIRQVNRTAQEELLIRCDETALAQYLQRLKELNNRRGRTSVWVRTGETTAIVRRVAA